MVALIFTGFELKNTEGDTSVAWSQIKVFIGSAFATLAVISLGSFFKTLQRHGAPCRVPQQALQLITPVRWHLGVGVQRKPVDTGTAGARECGAFPCIPKARANTSHPTPSTDRWAMMAPLSSPMLFLRLRTVYVLKGEGRWQQIP